MAVIEVPVSDTWSAGVTPAANETWQVKQGSVALSVAATPVANDGIELEAGDAIKVAAGVTVKYLNTSKSIAGVLVREALG